MPPPPTSADETPHGPLPHRTTSLHDSPPLGIPAGKDAPRTRRGGPCRRGCRRGRRRGPSVATARADAAAAEGMRDNGGGKTRSVRRGGSCPPIVVAAEASSKPPIAVAPPPFPPAKFHRRLPPLLLIVESLVPIFGDHSFYAFAPPPFSYSLRFFWRKNAHTHRWNYLPPIFVSDPMWHSEHRCGTKIYVALYHQNSSQE